MYSVYIDVVYYTMAIIATYMYIHTMYCTYPVKEANSKEMVTYERYHLTR